MGVRPTAKLLIFASVIEIVLVSCNVCPEKCVCTLFPSIGFRVKCQGILQVPRGLPVTTFMLDLSRNFLKAVPRDIFRNLTSLKSINLENNSIKGGFYLPKSVAIINMQENRLSLDDLRIILAKPKDAVILNMSGNPIGPNLTADVFYGFEKMILLDLAYCRLRRIQSGTFQSMKTLTKLLLNWNRLSQIQAGALEGPGSELSKLTLKNNTLLTIADGTFERFSGLNELILTTNQLQALPNFTGLTVLHTMNLEANQIKDISRLADYNIKQVNHLSLTDNKIEQLPGDVFQTLAVGISLDLSINKIKLIPDDTFSACKSLSEL